jgi:hypothetical protein
MGKKPDDWTFKQISFEDADNPETIYKYRSWENAYHKTILTDQIVYFARPTSFDDPLDCKIQKRYDLMTQDDIFEMYIRESKKYHPHWNRNQHRNFAKSWRKKSPLQNKNYVKQVQKQAFADFDARFGVLSLTANQKNFKMWEQYGDNHKGFCVGFAFGKVYRHFGGGVQVQYYDKLPDIRWDAPIEMEIFLQFSSKEKKWEYEQEYRAHKFHDNLMIEQNRQVRIPPGCFSHLIFGARMPESHKQEIIDVCNSNHLPVTFYNAVIVQSTNEIEIQPYNP